MRTKDLRNAPKSLLLNASPQILARWDWPGVVENEDGEPIARPYGEMTWVAANKRLSPTQDETLKGNEVNREGGSFAVAVVAERGDGEDEANDFADAIADLFYAGRQIPFTDGVMTIMKRPDVRPGYKDGSDWRVPVIVRYVANATS